MLTDKARRMIVKAIEDGESTSELKRLFSSEDIEGVRHSLLNAYIAEFDTGGIARKQLERIEHLLDLCQKHYEDNDSLIRTRAMDTALSAERLIADIVGTKAEVRLMKKWMNLSSEQIIDALKAKTRSAAIIVKAEDVT